MANLDVLNERAKKRENKNNETKERLEIFGNNIKQARESLNPKLTQKELASKLGITVAHMSHIETGRRPCPETARGKLVEILGVDVFDNNIHFTRRIARIHRLMEAYIVNDIEYYYIVNHILIRYCRHYLNLREFEDLICEQDKRDYKSINNPRLDILLYRLNHYLNKLLSPLEYTELYDSVKREEYMLNDNNFICSDKEKKKEFEIYNYLKNLNKKDIVYSYKIPLFNSKKFNAEKIYENRVCGSHTLNRKLAQDSYEYIAIYLSTFDMMEIFSPKYKYASIITVKLRNYALNNQDVLIKINGKLYIKNICIDDDIITISSPWEAIKDIQTYNKEDIKNLDIHLIGTIEDIYFNNYYNEEYVEDSDKIIL